MYTERSCIFYIPHSKHEIYATFCDFVLENMLVHFFQSLLERAFLDCFALSELISMPMTVVQ